MIKKLFFFFGGGQIFLKFPFVLICNYQTTGYGYTRIERSLLLAPIYLTPLQRPDACLQWPNKVVSSKAPMAVLPLNIAHNEVVQTTQTIEGSQHMKSYKTVLSYYLSHCSRVIAMKCSLYDANRTDREWMSMANGKQQCKHPVSSSHAPVPLKIIQSNSEFNEHFIHYIQIVLIQPQIFFCIFEASWVVLKRENFLCDRIKKCILIEFEIDLFSGMGTQAREPRAALWRQSH